ncbi:MAG: hypothetical protein WD425_11135 [Nitrospirales bacterium]
MHDSSDNPPSGAERRPAGAQPQGARRDPDGASPCNTAPSNCNSDGGITLLRLGIDSLYLSYQGFIYAETETKLQTLKELAQSDNSLNKALATYTVEGHQFEVKGKGAGYYPYVLSNNAYSISLSSGRAKQMPLAYVQIRSQWLTAKGIEYVDEELDSLISLLGWIEGAAQVSRADLFVDFISEMSVDGLSVGQFVSRARRISTHTMGRAFTGYSIGLGGDMSARLYDKTAEIKESGKEYLIPIWRDKGWNGQDTIYRLEFQLGRRILSEHEAREIRELLLKLGPLWRYATLYWLKLTIPSQTDTTQSRWPLHPAWAALSEIEWPDSLPGVSMPVRSQSIPGDFYLFENGLSGLTSFMAREGLTDPQEALQAYFDAARRFHNERSHFTGTDFSGYLQEKAALKARAYNLPYPGIEEKRDKLLTEAISKAYRKAKDGE